MADKIVLTSDEMQLILKTREKAERINNAHKTRIRALDIAHNYLIWLTKNKRASSISTFIDEFGYDDGNAAYMYRAVMKLIEVSITWD